MNLARPTVYWPRMDDGIELLVNVPKLGRCSRCLLPLPCARHTFMLIGDERAVGGGNTGRSGGRLYNKMSLLYRSKRDGDNIYQPIYMDLTD